MSDWLNLQLALRHGGVGRRDFLKYATALGIGAVTAQAVLAKAGYAAEPQSGGVLKLGMGGGSSTDTLDPRTVNGTVGIVTGFCLRNSLVEIDADGTAVPELAESWEAKPGAIEWIFNIRKDVTFSNGKTLDADDIIYSINLHRGPDTTSGGAAVMKAIKDIKKLSAHQILVTMDSPDADTPTIFADYHMQVVPNGFTDWSHPVGTGAFVLENYQPGIRIQFKKRDGYWKAGRGHLDGLDLTVVNDTMARVNALVSGSVDAVNRIDGKTAPLIEGANLQLVRSPGAQHYTAPMLIDHKPFDNPDTRLALKYAMDREKILKTVFGGYGSVGNDHPIGPTDPFCNTSLPQYAYDADKAKFHAKKAGLSDTVMTLTCSEGAFPGAVDMAVLYQADAARAGLNVKVDRQPADGYWDNIWLKAAWCTCFWVARASATQVLTVGYQSDAPWNDTHWRVPAFDKLLLEAKAELDTAKRKDKLWELQRMLHDDGGQIVAVFADRLEACTNKVGGLTAHGMDEMDNGRIGDKAWLIS
ncbi:MAG: ABC transporter substrate-binding protein [Rhodospirillaceae bacterium]|nr:MAG: ABC transporter substrate-binding protein [Rhodospirillaceae bacterium]